MTSHTNPTKKQHFVPQFYLKLFADQQNLLQVLDIKNMRLGLPRSPAGVAYEPYFYAIETGVPDEASQQIEDWLQKHEDIIAKELPQIIERILTHQQIDHDDRYILSALMCMFWLRSPKMRDQLNKMREDVTKKMMAFSARQRVDEQMEKTGIKLSAQDREQYIKLVEQGSYSVTFNNAQHLKFMTQELGFGGPGFTNMFYGHRWKIYIAKGKRKFVTTDSPVVEWWPPPKTFWDGGGFLERNKYFALTPEIFIQLTHPIKEGMKVQRETLFEDRDEKVATLNLLLAANSHEYVYSQEKGLLEGLLAGRAKPGKLERNYYEQFELPWKLARKK